MRGYPSANFIGRKLIVSNLEYQLPVWMLNRGFWHTAAVFEPSGCFFLSCDGVAVEGIYFSSKGPLCERIWIGAFFQRELSLNF